MSEHLDHDRGELSASGDVRDGSSQKTVRTDIGEVRISVPRDRAATFTPAVEHCCIERSRVILTVRSSVV